MKNLWGKSKNGKRLWKIWEQFLRNSEQLLFHKNVMGMLKDLTKNYVKLWKDKKSGTGFLQNFLDMFYFSLNFYVFR